MSELFSCPQRITPMESDTWQDRWKDTWPDTLGVAPVACSYCGCIRPEDAIRIIEAGFEIEPTTKSYKWYIGTPGNAAYHAKFMAAMSNDQLASVGDRPFNIGLPIKLYSHHLTKEQADILNTLYERQRKTIQSSESIQ